MKGSAVKNKIVGGTECTFMVAYLGAVTENWGRRLRKDRGTIEILRQEILIG